MVEGLLWVCSEMLSKHWKTSPCPSGLAEVGNAETKVQLGL